MKKLLFVAIFVVACRCNFFNLNAAAAAAIPKTKLPESLQKFNSCKGVGAWLGTIGYFFGEDDVRYVELVKALEKDCETFIRCYGDDFQKKLYLFSVGGNIEQNKSCFRELFESSFCDVEKYIIIDCLGLNYQYALNPGLGVDDFHHKLIQIYDKISEKKCSLVSGQGRFR